MNEARVAQLLAAKTAALAPRAAPPSNADAMNASRRETARKQALKLARRVADKPTRDALVALLELMGG
jgi:hypothetical protein